MKKSIPVELKEKTEKLFMKLADVDNIVHHDFKSTFTFKGRKSVLISEIIINELSEKNDLIFDPFMGGGSFVLSAVNKQRKIIATEIDNYTYNVIKVLFEACDFETLQIYFEKIELLCKQNIMDLYETTCCSNKNYINKLLFDPENQEYYNPTPNREIINNENIKLAFKCPICGKSSKTFDEKDMEKIDFIKNLDLSEFPKTRYIENSRINITASTGADYYDRIFTERNKVALLTLQKALDAIPNSKEKDFLQHVLVASLSLARIAMYGSSTDILYHVVMHGAQEMNVWLLFQKKYHSFLNFKKNYPQIQTDDIIENEKYSIYNYDYKYFLKANPNLVFDMIYTDFPYTDQVPYLERNQLFRIWLSKFADSEKYKLTEDMLKNEIVQTNAISRPEKKSISNYYKDIDTLFMNLSKHLKTGGISIFTIKLGKAKYFNTYIEIINLARKNGFEYMFRIGLEKNDPTLRKQSAYANTFINEMVVLFYKLPVEKRYWYVGDDNYEFEITKKIYKFLLKETPITLTTVVQIIINDLKSRYSHIASESDIERIKKIIESNFFADSGTVQISTNRLYLEIEDSSSLYIKLLELIPIHIGKLLIKHDRFVLEDLYFELVNSLCDGNPNTITQVLEDHRHQNDITNLIKNYCDLQGKYYVAKLRNVHLNENAVDISQLDGYEFEQLTKKLLNAEDFLNIVVKGGAGDLGVDIVASKLEHSLLKHYIFQCKRWTSDVGSVPIQRLVAERARLNVDYAVCYTTSDYTKDGKMIGETQDVKLVNGIELINKLNHHFPGQYYNGVPLKISGREY